MTSRPVTSPTPSTAPFPLPDIRNLSPESVGASLEAAAKFLATHGIGATPLRDYRIGNRRIVLKEEQLNPTGAYKERGAATAVGYARRVLGAQRGICASTGNFAKGVKKACQLEGLTADIFVPVTTPKEKLRALQGGNASLERLPGFDKRYLPVIHKQGRDFGEAQAAAERYAAETSAQGGAGGRTVLLEPYDDMATIVGQATIGVEMIVQQPPEFDIVLVPLGGGGIAAGMCLAIKLLLKLNSGHPVRVIGVASEGATALYHSLRSGRYQTKKTTPSVAQGVSVERPGRRFCWKILHNLMDDVVLVSDDDVHKAMFLLHEKGVRAEGAGALATAAYLAGKIDPLDESRSARVAAVVTGGNVGEEDFSRCCERGKSLIDSKRRASRAGSRPSLIR